METHQLFNIQVSLKSNFLFLYKKTKASPTSQNSRPVTIPCEHLLTAEKIVRAVGAPVHTFTAFGRLELEAGVGMV